MADSGCSQVSGCNNMVPFFKKYSPDAFRQWEWLSWDSQTVLPKLFGIDIPSFTFFDSYPKPQNCREVGVKVAVNSPRRLGCRLVDMTSGCKAHGCEFDSQQRLFVIVIIITTPIAKHIFTHDEAGKRIAATFPFFAQYVFKHHVPRERIVWFAQKPHNTILSTTRSESGLSPYSHSPTARGASLGALPHKSKLWRYFQKI